MEESEIKSWEDMDVVLHDATMRALDFPWTGTRGREVALDRLRVNCGSVDFYRRAYEAALEEERLWKAKLPGPYARAQECVAINAGEEGARRRASVALNNARFAACQAANIDLQWCDRLTPLPPIAEG